MKKILAILLAVCMVLSLAACGGDSGSDATNPGGSSTPTQGSQSGDSKDPATQPTTQNDPQEGHDPDDSGNEGNDPDDEDETTEPTQGAVDLSNEPNPLGLNSLILAAYLNNCGTFNYSTGEINKQEVTREMLDGIYHLEITVDFSGESSQLAFYSACVVDAEENLYEYVDLSCSLDFVPDFSGDALQTLLEDLKDCKLTQIKLTNLPISDLTPLAMFPELDWVYACYCENLTSLAGLENLTMLNRLDCHSGYALEDISALANLISLEYVDLGSNNITDLTPLAGLVNVETMHLGGNPITDMSPLANLPALKTLSLGSTDIEVIPEGGTTAVTNLGFGGYDSVLSDITNIAQWVSEEDTVTLGLSYANLDSLSGIEKVYLIDFMNISGDTITNEDMAFLGKAHIKQLLLTGTAVTDLSAFAGNEYIEQITVTTPELTDLTPLASCHNLTSVNVEGTAVTDVSCLSGLENLTSLTLSRTPFSDVSSLLSFPILKYLTIANCTGITDISPLAASTTLQVIVIRGLEGLDASAFDGTEIEVRTW